MEQDRAYYLRRKEQAQRLADRAINGAIRTIHQEMADRYAQLASVPADMDRVPLRMTVRPRVV